MNASEQITEAEETKRGALLARVLGLRRDFEHKDRWRTEWGTKTDLGLFRTVAGIVNGVLKDNNE